MSWIARYNGLSVFGNACNSVASLTKNFLAFATLLQVSRKTFWRLQHCCKSHEKLSGVCNTVASLTKNFLAFCSNAAKASKNFLAFAGMLQRPRKTFWSLQNFCKRQKGENWGPQNEVSKGEWGKRLRDREIQKRGCKTNCPRA